MSSTVALACANACSQGGMQLHKVGMGSNLQRGVEACVINEHVIMM